MHGASGSLLLLIGNDKVCFSHALDIHIGKLLMDAFDNPQDGHRGSILVLLIRMMEL